MKLIKTVLLVFIVLFVVLTITIVGFFVYLSKNPASLTADYQDTIFGEYYFNRTSALSTAIGDGTQNSKALFLENYTFFINKYCSDGKRYIVCEFFKPNEQKEGSDGEIVFCKDGELFTYFTDHHYCIFDTKTKQRIQKNNENEINDFILKNKIKLTPWKYTAAFQSSEEPIHEIHYFE